jgi:hypothetical protein
VIKIWQAKKTRKWKDKFATLFSIMIAKRNLQLARFVLEKGEITMEKRSVSIAGISLSKQ